MFFTGKSKHRNLKYSDFNYLDPPYPSGRGIRSFRWSIRARPRNFGPRTENAKVRLEEMSGSRRS
jgi:hypothetical protein